MIDFKRFYPAPKMIAGVIAQVFLIDPDPATYAGIGADLRCPPFCLFKFSIKKEIFTIYSSFRHKTLLI